MEIYPKFIFCEKQDTLTMHCGMCNSQYRGNATDLIMNLLASYVYYSMYLPLHSGYGEDCIHI